MSVLDLARPEVRALAPYSSARMEAGAAPVMLNANESARPPRGDTGRGLHRYPEPQPPALRARLAELYGVRDDRVLLGRGSDEAIDWLLRAFCRPGGDAIAICPPTFGLYAVSAGIQCAQVLRVPLTKTFAVDADALLAALTPAVKLVFLCSPNNPTGGVTPWAVIERLAAALIDRALVIVDEAYVEFADTASAATLLSSHPNLGVLRTLSKARALAGARIGALLADPRIITLLRRIMPPYPLAAPAVEAALAALDDAGEAAMRKRVATVAMERERLEAALAALAGVRAVLPSQANFLCVRFADAAGAYEGLLERGIVVRDVSRYTGLADCLRISIGTAADNDRVLAALAARAAA